MKIFFFVCVFLAPFVSIAQIYRGTIDKYPIIFEVSQERYNEYAARYYYLSTKQNIMLYRDVDDTTRLSTYPDQTQVREIFVLEANGKKLTGKWMHKGKTLKVDLTKDETIKAFSDPKFTGTKIKKIKDEKYDASTVLTWYKEPVTGIEGFQIKSSTKIKQLEKVNKLLREHHLGQAKSAVDCIDGSPRGGEYSVSMRLSYLDNNLMSVAWFTSYYCGGAHPDGGENAFTIDLTTLKELHLRDLYWLSNEPYKQVKDDYDMPNYGEVWQELLNKQYPDQYPMEQPENEEGCTYSPGVWAIAGWYLTPSGLYISSFFPRVAKNCDTYNGEPFVSYKLLEKYRVKTNKYVLK